MKPAKRIQHVSEYYFSKKLREIRQKTKDGASIINVGIGSPDLPPHPSVVEATQQMIAEPYIHGYQPYKGIEQLRTAIASFYKNQYDADVNPDTEVLPLIGSKEGILHLSMAYVDPGDSVLIPNPGYPTYASVSRLCGAEIIPYHLEEGNGWQPSVEEIARLMQDHSSIKILWINTLHMPTGSMLEQTILDELIELCASHDVLLVNDNPYSLVLQDTPRSIYSNTTRLHPHCVELNSLSKSANMAGWRIGMMVAPQEHIDHTLRFKSNMDSGMFYAMQIGAINALRLGSEWYDELNAIYRRRQEVALAILDSLRCEYKTPQYGMFVWGRTPEGETAETVSDKLLEEHEIFVAPGFIFGSAGSKYIRISLCVEEQILERALERIESKVK